MAKVVESFDEFKARQGCDYLAAGTTINVTTGDDVTRWLFANGAESNGQQHSDPPADPHALLLLRREYVRARLDLEVRAWTDYKAHCLELASNAKRFPRSCPSAPEDAPMQLTAGAERIAALRAELAHLNEMLSDALGLARQRAAELADDCQSARAAGVVAAIQNLTI